MDTRLTVVRTLTAIGCALLAAEVRGLWRFFQPPDADGVSVPEHVRARLLRFL